MDDRSLDFFDGFQADGPVVQAVCELLDLGMIEARHATTAKMLLERDMLWPSLTHQTFCATAPFAGHAVFLQRPYPDFTDVTVGQPTGPAHRPRASVYRRQMREKQTQANTRSDHS
jgi:hypothetical protein